MNFLPSLWNIVFAVVIVVTPIVGVILGAVLGVVFMAFRNRIPGSTIMRKSLVFSLCFIVLSLLLALRDYFNFSGRAIYAAVPSFVSLEWISLAFTFVEYPVLGCLFGYLLQRRLRKNK